MIFRARLQHFPSSVHHSFKQMSNLNASRLDNFDFLRLFAACLVLFSHQYSVLGQTEPALYSGRNLGNVGVLIFFSISGYLVTQSWCRDPHAMRFILKRFLRIWPGIAVVTLLCAFVLGPIVTTLPWKTYFAAPEFFDYLGNLRLVRLIYVLPGVFETNPYPQVVDGPLWTISIELRWYLILLAVGLAGFLHKRWLVAASSAAFVFWYFVVENGAMKAQYEFGLFFCAGACLALFREEWQERPFALLAIGAATAMAACIFGRYNLALVCALPIFIVLAGTRSTPVLNRFGRFGDFSFGIYIYAFPVQQTIAWATGNSLSFAYGLTLSALVTLVCAVLSWHLVEHPALGLKHSLPRMDMSSIVSRLRFRRS